MKKFLTAIVFLIFTGAGFAQCINVQTTAIKGNCYSDNQIKVTAQDMTPYPSICLPSSGKFIVEIQGPGKDGEMFRMNRPSPSAPAEYTFYNLKVGKYKIIVRDEDTGAFDEREVDADSNYKVMNIQNLEALSPSCGQPNNGGVRFKIPNGGIGPFQVTIFDMAKNVIVPMQEFSRPANNGYIEVRGDNAHPLPINKQIIVQIHDKTNIGNQCGETRRFPSIQIPSQQKYVVECINIKTYLRRLEKNNKDCKYRFRIDLVRPEDNQLIYQGIDDMTEFRNFFKKPGTAVLRIVNKGISIDMSSTFSDYYYYTNSYEIESGDEIEITIKGPKNTIKERFKLDNRINASYYGPLIYNARDCSRNHTYYTEGNCGNITPNTQKYLCGTYDTRWGTYNINYTDLNNGESRNIYQVSDWRSGYGNLKLQRKVGTNWVDEPSYTPSTPGATYRYTYKTTPPGCPPTVSNEFVSNYPPHSAGTPPAVTARPIEKVWDALQTGYGIYEGTGAFKFNLPCSTFFYPLNFKIERADGVASITYQGKIGFSDTVTRTITFPLIKPANSCQTLGYTNLPAGRYKITVTDACSKTTTREIDLAATTYNPVLKYERDCEIGKVIFDIGRSIKVNNNSSYDRVYLQQEVEDQYGNKSWQYKNGSNGQSFIDDQKGFFPPVLLRYQ